MMRCIVPDIDRVVATGHAPQNMILVGGILPNIDAAITAGWQAVHRASDKDMLKELDLVR